MIEEDLGLALTQEQASRLVLLYELDEETGQRLVRRAALRRPKGAGKSPEGAYCGYCELVGPVEFGGFDVHGQPVGHQRSDPWVQFAAVSEDQTDNVMVWLFEALADRPDTRARHGVDLGRSRVYLRGRAGRIEPVTAAAGSREGQRITFAVLDQTESWNKSNGGTRLADVLRRNAAKMGGWTYELQNAPVPGDGSVADDTATASQRRAPGVLFDSREAPWVEDLTDRLALLDALRVAYEEAAIRSTPEGLAGWVDLERLADEIQDPATDESDARRYYLNQGVALTNQWMDPAPWKAREAPAAVVAPRERITLGFHGAQTRTASALIGCRVRDGHLFTLGIWEPAATEQVRRTEVDAAMASAVGRFDVLRAYVDPANWQDELIRWQREWGDDRILAWWTTRNSAMARALERLHTAVMAQSGVTHDADARLTEHIGNARREETRAGVLIRPPVRGGRRQIVAATAATLAFEARADAIAAGLSPPATAAKHEGGSGDLFRPRDRLRI